jgi:3-deoxy-7-phosphoheptulonate synthase
MRTYLSKPRTCLGWKGFLYDPDLNETYNLNKGLLESRKLLYEITSLGVPCAMEYLDTISPQYFDDLLVWGAIGARTTQSQIHRELCSGISTPVGFKNSLNGDIDMAINSIKCSSRSHVFLGCDNEGQTCSVRSKGNPWGHVILRGSDQGPNYDLETIQDTKKKLEKNGIDLGIIVDCSHGNSGKDYRKQKLGVEAIIDYYHQGYKEVKGIMLESNLKQGNQKLGPDLKYGLSITDSCIGLDETRNLLEKLYSSLK